jgi:acetyl-CoA C-acetyltransferase
MQEVFIVSAVRTPIGSFGGSLASLSATELGAIAIKAAVERAGIKAEQVDEVFMGNVVSANLGQAPARQAALKAGLGMHVPCTTVNKVCASGTKAAMFGAQSIMLGMNQLVVAGGMESMSNIPFYVPKARFGYKYGHGELLDGLMKDGLTDVYSQKAMGVCADQTAKKFEISREEQDAYAIRSYQLSGQHTQQGSFRAEICPVEVPQRKGTPLLVVEDEEYKNVAFDKIPQLKPVFTPDGTVTAANASTINDGASALLLASKKAVTELGLKPLARIVAFADGAREPEWFTVAPVIAAQKTLKAAGLQVSDIDVFEVNEAFAVVPMAFGKEMGIEPDEMNIRGGAVSLGHPLGASGARILTTLTHILHSTDHALGMLAICNGGGGASSMIIEKVVS